MSKEEKFQEKPPAKARIGKAFPRNSRRDSMSIEYWEALLPPTKKQIYRFAPKAIELIERYSIKAETEGQSLVTCAAWRRCALCGRPPWRSSARDRPEAPPLLCGWRDKMINRKNQNGLNFIRADLLLRLARINRSFPTIKALAHWRIGRRRGRTRRAVTHKSCIWP